MSNNRIAAACLLPSFLLVAVFIAFPILKTFVTAFSQVGHFGEIERLGSLDNFRRCLADDPVFWLSLRNTMVWTVGIVSLTLLISLPASLLLNERFRGRVLLRATLMLPWASSLMINALVWRLILDDSGSLNLLLRQLGLARENVLWRSNSTLIFGAMILIGVLVSIPFTTTVLLAGLQSIPGEVYEAAIVDGARNRNVLRQITLPLLRPVFTVAALLNVIHVFNSFPLVWTITRGDPVDRTHLLITYLFKLAFGDYSDPGKAAAVGVITFALLMTFSVLYTRKAMSAA